MREANTTVLSTIFYIESNLHILETGAFPLQTVITYQLLFFNYLKNTQKVFRSFGIPEDKLKVGFLNIRSHGGLLWKITFNGASFLIAHPQGSLNLSHYTRIPLLQEAQNWTEQDYETAIRNGLSFPIKTAPSLDLQDISRGLSLLKIFMRQEKSRQISLAKQQHPSIPQKKTPTLPTESSQSSPPQNFPPSPSSPPPPPASSPQSNPLHLYLQKQKAIKDPDKQKDKEKLTSLHRKKSEYLSSKNKIHFSA